MHRKYTTTKKDISTQPHHPQRSMCSAVVCREPQMDDNDKQKMMKKGKKRKKNGVLKFSRARCVRGESYRCVAGGGDKNLITEGGPNPARGAAQILSCAAPR